MLSKELFNPRMEKAYIDDLLENGSREELINWLDMDDPNGVWTDADSEMEGMDPITLDEAKRYVKQAYEWR